MNRRHAARRTADRMLNEAAPASRRCIVRSRARPVPQLTAAQEALYGGISEHAGFSLEASAVQLRGLNEMMAASERLGLYDLELEALGLSDPLIPEQVAERTVAGRVAKRPERQASQQGDTE